MDEKQNKNENLIKKWGLGSILALGAFLVILTVRIEKIPVLERRIENKTIIIEQLEKESHEHDIEFLEYKLEQKDKEIEFIKITKDLEKEVVILKTKQ